MRLQLTVALAAGMVVVAPTLARAQATGVSLELQHDRAAATGDDVCGRESQLDGVFTCFRARGSQYHGTPVRPGARASGELWPGTTRLLVRVDRLVASWLTVAARAGVVVQGGGPKPDGADVKDFFPGHLELRLTGWATEPPRASSASWGAFVAAGMAQVDGHRRMRVDDDTSAPPSAGQLDNPSSQTLDVYRKLGRGFVGAGLEGWLGVGGGQGALASVQLSRFFPSDGFALSLSIGWGKRF